MLITSHVAAGALVSRRFRHPAAAFSAGVLSHLVLDAVPHWGTTDHRAFLAVARVDGVVGLALLLALVVRAAAVDRGRLGPLLAALAGSTLPDLDKPLWELLGVRVFPPDVRRFLAMIQVESPDVLGREAAVALLLAGAALAAGSVRVRRQPPTLRVGG